MDRSNFLKKTITVVGGIATGRPLGETNALATESAMLNIAPIMDYVTLNNGY